MVKSKNLIVNLVGNFSLKESEETYLKLQNFAPNLKAVIFEGSNLNNISLDSLENLKKSIFILREYGVEIAFANFKFELESILKSNIDKTLLNLFALKDEAKEFLQNKLEITEDEINTIESVPEIKSATFKDEAYYTFCPNCNAKLRLKKKGNYKCPSCQTKFYFNPTNEIVKYERISLE